MTSPTQTIASISKPLYNDIVLSNYAFINVKDEILRVDGVSDISIMGERDYSIRVWLDPQKMASRNIAATDVPRAIQEQNIQAAAGQVGQPPVRAARYFSCRSTPGPALRSEEFEKIIVKTGQPGDGNWRHGVTATSPGSGTGTGRRSTSARPPPAR